MPAISRIFIARASRLFLILFLLVGVVAASIRFAPAAPVQPNNLPAISTSGISATDVKANTGSPMVASGPAAVEGWVRAKDTLAPVALAVVHLGEATTQSNEQGYFSFGAEASAAVRSASAEHSWTLSVRVEADGSAPWAIDNATYYEGDVLRLYASLEAAGSPQVQISAARPRFSQQQQDTGEAFGQIDNAHAPAAGQDGNVQTNEVQANGQLLGPNAPTAPPGTIRVYRTAQNTVEVVPFRDYVKHVLPNEWIPTWASESLKAGAMAVKSYAWYWVSRGGKQVALGADVKDNVEDQVYDPNVSYASTDAAVDATFDYVMSINGALFAAQYCAGSYSGEATGACPWNSLYMTQWGSAYYADRGKTWSWILGFYYYGSRVAPNPPGGGYDGRPPATAVAQPTSAPPPPPPPNADYSVGQGADQPDIFRQAYDRNGGQTALGKPTGPVRWWLPNVTEF